MVTPPLNKIKQGGHHWLEMFDSDGHSFGLIILYWQPVIQKWCQSGNWATGMDYVVPETWKYVAEVKVPE